MNGTTNIVGITFEALASARIAQIQAAMNAVIGAELNYIVPVLDILFPVFVGLQFFLVMFGHMTISRFFSQIGRAGVVVFLLVHSGTFVQYVETPLFTTIPQQISSIVLNAVGTGNISSTASIAQQFDQVSNSFDAVTALAASRSVGWSVSGLINYAAINLEDFLAQLLLAIMAAIWLIGQTLLAIVLCFGPPLIIFELFDRTRGWIDGWIGKIVGLLAFGLGTSILVAIEMQGLIDNLASAHANLPTEGPQAVSLFLHIIMSVVIDAFAMGALPLICALGAGAVGALAGPSAMAMGRAATGGLAMAGAAKFGGGGGGGSNSIKPR